MKRIKWIAGSIVVLLVLVVVIVLMSINSIVKNQIESQASSSLNLKTTLGSANVSILGGSLGLNDLAVASPEGFSADHMFALGGAKMGVSLGGLRGDPVAIDQVVIDKPKLVIEQAGGKFNFEVLKGKESKPTPEGQEPVKLVIKELSINEAQVLLRPGIPGLQSEVTIPIPSFTVKDVGTGEGNQNGVAIKEVVMLTIMSLAQKATESGALPEDVKALLKLDVDQITKQVEAEVGKRIEGLKQDVTGEIEKAVGEQLGGEIGRGLGNLLQGRGRSTTQPGR